MQKPPYKFGLIGSNIKYTMSPEIHAKIWKTLGIQASYEILDIETAEFESTIQKLEQSGEYLGLNITAPFKRQAAHYTNAPLSSINTLYRGDDGRFLGASTDGAGFLMGLGEAGYDLEKFSEILIIGNGGATESLLESGIFNSIPVRVFSRKPANCLLDQKYAKTLSAHLLDDFYKYLSSRFTLVVQATSAPHKKESLPVINENLSQLNGLFYDLCYNPASNAEAFLNPNTAFTNGLPMLHYQALESYGFWLKRQK